MKERPIIFSTEMVRAILDGRKTQTRRVVKFSVPFHDHSNWKSAYRWGNGWIFWGEQFQNEQQANEFMERAYGPSTQFTDGKECPYGVPGDRLWVRETWLQFPWVQSDGAEVTKIAYRANGENSYPRHKGDKWKPSIHMPRWASRILLEVTDVRVQRLYDITKDDAIAEGCAGPGYGDLALLEYCRIWDSINARRGYPWKSNPWVWAITFNVVDIAKAGAA